MYDDDHVSRQSTASANTVLSCFQKQLEAFAVGLLLLDEVAEFCEALHLQLFILFD